MGHKKLILKMLELSQELDKTDKQFESSMIVNDMTLLINKYIDKQLDIHRVSGECKTRQCSDSSGITDCGYTYSPVSDTKYCPFCGKTYTR